MKIWQMKKNDLHIKKIAVKKTEKARVKQMKKKWWKAMLLYHRNCWSSFMIQKLHERLRTSFESLKKLKKQRKKIKTLNQSLMKTKMKT